MQSLESAYKPDDFIPHYFTDPKKAEEFINNSPRITLPNNIAKMLSSPERFKEIVMVITDQDMPSISGLEFLKKIDGDLVKKKILLTGFVEDRAAVNAFNKREINGFIKKDDPELLDVLTDLVTSLAAEWQGSLGPTQMDHVVDQLFKQHFMKECYPLDQKGSHLLLDGDGSMLHFQVFDDEELEDQSEFVKVMKGNPGLIEDIRTRRRAFSYLSLSEDEVIPEPREWGAYMQNLTRDEVTGLCYASVSLPQSRNIVGFNPAN